jgi:hypothetical protein
MFTFPKDDYQRQLIVASLDDFSPNATLPNFQGGQFGEDPNSWRSAVVDFLCANLQCGLIEATHRPDITESRNVVALREVLAEGDEVRNIPVDILWDVLYFNGSEKLSELLERLNLRTWDAVTRDTDSTLIAELTDLYKGYVSGSS